MMPQLPGQTYVERYLMQLIMMMKNLPRRLADADEDGKLSMQEVMDASGEDFAIVRKACETADVNDDQFIDADELPKLMKALM